MSKLVEAIASVRNSVCSVLLISPTPTNGQFTVDLVGTAWCVANGVFVTAHHVMNPKGGLPPGTRFYLLRPLENGTLTYWLGGEIKHEDAEHDLAIITTTANPGCTPIPIVSKLPPDGTQVLTFGCPAPEVHEAVLTPDGYLAGLTVYLLTHANIGIVSGQRNAPPKSHREFEFNVGWHHGESGGPVLQLDEPQLGAFAVMNGYRSIQGAHGIIPGPRYGFSLMAIEPALKAVGAKFI